MKDSALSEAGRIYAEENDVLEAARGDFHRFLGAVNKKVESMVSAKLAERNEAVMEAFEYVTGSNKSWSLWIALRAKSGKALLREGKDEMWVGYGDATINDSPANALTCGFYVELGSSFFKALQKAEVQERIDAAYVAASKAGLDMDAESRDAYNTTLPLDPSSSSRSADAIVDLLLNCLRGLEAFAMNLALIQ